jgi:hypothetical protein
VETASEVLAVLARRYAFGDLAAMAGPGPVRQLCAFGQRLLDLDAEDFGTAGTAVPGPLIARARACRMPQAPDEQPRGALGSLRPTYALLLEVIAARWARRELSALVAAVHISSEYLPLLAWEAVLGHAGDPVLLAPLVRGSRWGVRDDERCPHGNADRAAAARVLHLDARGWRAYLDRQHSNVAHALGVCAAECHRPCGFVDGRPHEPSRLALAYADSPIVRLRHAAPVGHGFGVPSHHEVAEAWQQTRAHLGAAAQEDDDGYPLPGLPGLFSAVAGTPIAPDTLLADTALAVERALAPEKVAR